MSEIERDHVPIVDYWFATSTDIHNLRTAYIAKSALTAIHHVAVLTQKLLLMVSFPRTDKIQQILNAHYEAYERYISSLEKKYEGIRDPVIERELNDMKIRLEVAKTHNTFVDLLAPISLLHQHLEKLISASTAIEGRGMKTLLRIRDGVERKRSLFFGGGGGKADDME